MNKYVEFILKVLIIMGIITAVKFYYSSQEKRKGHTFDQSPSLRTSGGDFTLSSSEGKAPFTLKDLAGKPSILYFGFTNCPDICPLSLSRLMKVLEKILPSEPQLHDKINKVFISVDYKRDTPQEVKDYAHYFGNFIGLTGTKAQIEDITKKYGVFYKFVKLKDSAMKYTVDHSSRFYLLNGKGKLINSYSDIENDPQFTYDLKKLLSK